MGFVLVEFPTMQLGIIGVYVCIQRYAIRTYDNVAVRDLCGLCYSHRTFALLPYMFSQTYANAVYIKSST